MSSAWQRRLLGAGLLAGAFLLGSAAQERLGIEFSLDQIDVFRHWVADLGWWGPVAFVLLVIFRLFIGLSSHLVLILGGLVFGAIGGIVWGSIGLVLSALVLYALAAQLGAQWVERRFGAQYAAMLARVQRLGAMAIFAVSAHPFGLLTPAHLAAGLVNLGWARFALAVTLAAPLRAAPYVVLGTAILDLPLEQSLAIAAGLVLLLVVPLAHPGVRRWVRADGNADAAGNANLIAPERAD